MKEKFRKRVLAVLAIVICLSIALVACTPPAPYVEDGLSVVLEYNDSVSRPRTVYLEEGETLATPDVPVREGYQITGWYTASEGGDEVTFPYAPTQNVTLYAQWEAAVYNVNFDFNFTGSTPLVKEVAYGETVTAPTAAETPAYAGHYLYRWETRAENGSAVSFPYTVRRSTTFYAAWLSNETQIFQVTFDGNYEGAAEYDPISVVQGNAVTARDVPSVSQTGFEFAGWATTPNATQPNVTIPYTPTANVTLYAVWKRGSYSVRFRNNYTGADTTYLLVTEEGGTEIDAPTPPVRDGFIFQGWYTSATNGNLTEFPLTVTTNLNLYAQWKSEFVTTNTFDAEFFPINSAMSFPGFSGSTWGTGIIQADGGGWNATSQPYPLLDDNHSTHQGHYIIGVYATGSSLSFEVTSSSRVENATLYISLSIERFPGGYVVAPTGENGYQILVNGNSINYGSFDLRNNAPDVDTPVPFKEFTVGNITLNAGVNTVTLVSNNNTVNGTMTARCPMVDYVKIGGAPDGSLSWQPEYDNLYRSR